MALVPVVLARVVEENRLGRAWLERKERELVERKRDVVEREKASLDRSWGAAALGRACRIWGSVVRKEAISKVGVGGTREGCKAATHFGSVEFWKLEGARKCS